MMKWRAAILGVPVLFVLLAGCHTPPEGADGGVGDGAMGSVSVTVTETPQAAQIGETFTWKWIVDAEDGESIPHTAIHWADFSVPSDPSPAAYGNGTNAPDFYTGSAPQEFSHPMTFNDVGMIYFRAHAVVKGENFWTNEMTLPVGDLDMTDPPSALDDEFRFSATLPVSGFTDHAGAHYSTQQGWKLGDEGVRGTPHKDANFTAGEATQITDTFNPDAPGTYYVRAHVRLDGVNYLGKEIMVIVA